MSSPIANKEKGAVKKALINFHQKASHNHRVDLLAKMIGDIIGKLYPNDSNIRCIDIGCGDMTIAENIKLKNDKTNWTCIDIYPLPTELEGVEKWKKYKEFDGQHIPFNDNHFKASVFCDVLHHIPGDLIINLKEAARVSEYVIIKDHFEKSLYSRTMLQLMDIVGNWGYGVSIPKRYFSRKRFEALIETCGLEIVEIHPEISLYEHNALFNAILRAGWQFIAVLKKKA